jgi:hypothetical protein
MARLIYAPMKSRFLLTRVGDSCFFQALDSEVLANKNNKKLMPRVFRILTVVEAVAPEIVVGQDLAHLSL